MNTHKFGKQLSRLTILLSGLLLCGTAMAELSSASVTPLQRNLQATTMNTVAVTWSVTATGLTAPHVTGVTSANATLVNADNGNVLGSIGMPLSAGGGGPFSFTESLIISNTQVTSWQNMGISRVAVRRLFEDPGSPTTVTAAMTLLVPERGDLTGVQVSPAQRQVVAGQTAVIPLGWQVAAGASHSSGVQSLFAELINPRTGAVLLRTGEALSSSGAGPYLFTETLEIDSATLQGWAAQRINRIVVRRTFVDPVGGANVEGSMVLLLSASSLTAVRDNLTGTLSIQGMRLEFPSGNNLALAGVDTELQARLTLSHSGSGLLEGRWLLAEPGSTEGNPLYRTLSLVRLNLVANQRSVLESPQLPTLRAGKYLLRFCVTSRELITDESLQASQCPIESLMVDGSYQVQGETADGVAIIDGLSPQQQVADSKTPFSWNAVPQARVYQLQVFALVAGDGKLASAKEEQVVEPRFVVGMVLPAATTRTPLSELVRVKLHDGERYLWRITAHDDTGRLLASSAESSFIYRADKNP